MRKILFLNIVLFFLIVCSCENKIKFTDDINNFDVSVEKTTVQVGEEVVFNFSGNPDLISFYSGETLHDYAYKDKRINAINKTYLSFSTSHPTLSNSQIDQLAVMISPALGVTIEQYSDISKLNWIDITDKFKLATSGSTITSGVLDISNYLDESKSFYIAYRYTTRPQLTNGVAREWRISKFSITVDIDSYADGYEFYFTNGHGFNILEKDQIESQSAIQSNRLLLLGNKFSEDYDPDTETWAVSKLLVTDKIEVNPSYSIPVKGFQTGKIEQFKYSYEKAGTYKVYFVAKNVNIDNEVELVREIEIIVTDK